MKKRPLTFEGVRRLNIALDAFLFADLATLAASANLQAGTLARVMLSRAIKAEMGKQVDAGAVVSGAVQLSLFDRQERGKREKSTRKTT